MTVTDMLHVTYKGAAAALQDVMGGRIAMSVDIITSSVPLVKTGKLNTLAITGAAARRCCPTCPRWPRPARVWAGGASLTSSPVMAYRSR